jgi:hypothetical protein
MTIGTVPRILSRVQTVITRTFTAEATVLRKSSVSDGAGGSVDSYAAVGTYPCSFSPPMISPLERETAFGIQAVGPWVFRFPAFTDIRPTDRLVVDDRTFEVVSPTVGSIEIMVRVNCQEIT